MFLSNFNSTLWDLSCFSNSIHFGRSTTDLFHEVFSETHRLVMPISLIAGFVRTHGRGSLISCASACHFTKDFSTLFKVKTGKKKTESRQQNGGGANKARETQSTKRRAVAAIKADVGIQKSKQEQRTRDAGRRDQ